jgi:hypothetical protein
MVVRGTADVQDEVTDGDVRESVRMASETPNLPEQEYSRKPLAWLYEQRRFWLSRLHESEQKGTACANSIETRQVALLERLIVKMETQPGSK